MLRAQGWTGRAVGEMRVRRQGTGMRGARASLAGAKLGAEAEAHILPHVDGAHGLEPRLSQQLQQLRLLFLNLHFRKRKAELELW